ncbi:hypothetical protein M413DRAFT_244181 [Hebeloma cylindrosporum]|uniref:Uncharacterized protein n=1 Tax=Hebeloma cylindrosporum TaxID=76867 RepID=A0A0C3BNR0_HEBCY|nr:hypothetical protein M413DRAFT_244181 [Hebeloma cylindrosporum h7]
MSSHENSDLTNSFFRGCTESTEINSTNLQTALDAHRIAAFTIAQKRRSIPDFEELEKAETEPEDELKLINERITLLGDNHLKDLERLYTIQAINYKAEVKDQYVSFNESELEVPGTEPSVIEEIFANGPVKEFSIENTWNNDYDLIRYTYLSQVLGLQKRRQQIQAQRERERKEFEKQFPQTTEEFESKPMDMQIRVARFLTAEKAQKEKLLSEFDWAWRQTEALEKIFKADQLFASEVRSMLLSVVQSSRDPRRL